MRDVEDLSLHLRAVTYGRVTSRVCRSLRCDPALVFFLAEAKRRREFRLAYAKRVEISSEREQRVRGSKPPGLVEVIARL